MLDTQVDFKYLRMQSVDICGSYIFDCSILFPWMSLHWLLEIYKTNNTIILERTKLRYAKQIGRTESRLKIEKTKNVITIHTTICYCNQLRCAVICFYMTLPTTWRLYHNFIRFAILFFFLSRPLFSLCVTFSIKCKEIDIVLFGSGFFFLLSRKCVFV